MKKMMPILLLAGALTTFGIADACLGSSRDPRIQITTDRVTYSANEPILISILVDKADVAANARVADPKSVGVRTDTFEKDGVSIAPNAAIADDNRGTIGGGPEPVMSVQQYAATHADAYVSIARRDLATLGYKNLAPGDYALSLKVHLIMPGSPKPSVMVATNCVHFRVQ